MKTLIFSLLISSMVHAETKQIFPKGPLFPPGQCVLSGMLHMFIESKVDKDTFMVVQDLGYDNAQIGAIHVKNGNFFKGQRVASIWLSYVKTITVKGDDGFDHAIDIWESCNK